MDFKEYEDHAKIELPELQEVTRPHLQGHCISEFYEDTTPYVEDLIVHALILPCSLNFLFGQAKIGKTLFMQTWMLYMACGLDFLGLESIRPLKVFFFQMELPYNTLRKRINSLFEKEPELKKIYNNGHKGNLHITYDVDLLINHDSVDYLCNEIDRVFPDEPPDIILIDPMVNAFDHKEFGEENNNSHMKEFLKFLKREIIVKRFPESSLLITHHISKMNYDTLMVDPFMAARGASSLRGFYDSAIMMVGKPSTDVVHLLFEQRHAVDGENIERKDVTLDSGIFKEPIQPNKRGKPNKNKHNETIRMLDEDMIGVYNYMLEKYGKGEMININTLSAEYCTDGYDYGQIVYNTIEVLSKKNILKYNEDGTIFLIDPDYRTNLLL